MINASTPRNYSPTFKLLSKSVSSSKIQVDGP